VIEACWYQCAFVSMWPNNALELEFDVIRQRRIMAMNVHVHRNQAIYPPGR
jgi:hypothetical protein